MIVDLPEISENAPLVVMLHGYGGSAESFRTDTAFHEKANEEGFAVAYITGACAPDDSFSSTGWNSWDWNSNSLSDIDTTGLILDFLETQK
ncbi:PHB depolymerase family esterase [Ruminococcus flavefaciens]|uniref:PHB depolymerase family esterase n=1 Tax=Ruminococcus flavefaciens TaxID=1265 RepID=UPI00048E9DC7|nr:PHB depolymerase family esterase [Ruminococcus flavefaciens]